MAVNKVEIGGETVLDLTGDTVTSDNLAYGITAHGANGEVIVGTKKFCRIYSTTNPALTASAGIFTWTVPATDHGFTSKVLGISLYDSEGQMVFTNVMIDSSYNIVVSMYDEAVATIEAGEYMIVVVGED